MDFGFWIHTSRSKQQHSWASAQHVCREKAGILVYVRGGDSGSRKVPRKTIDSARFVHFRYFVFSCDESCPVSFSSIFFSLVWHVFHYLIIVFQCFFFRVFIIFLACTWWHSVADHTHMQPKSTSYFSTEYTEARQFIVIIFSPFDLHLQRHTGPQEKQHLQQRHQSREGPVPAQSP